MAGKKEFLRATASQVFSQMSLFPQIFSKVICTTVEDAKICFSSRVEFL